MRALSRTTLLPLVLAGLSACADHNPTSVPITASRSGLPFGVGLASPAWQALATARVIGSTPPIGSLNPAQATHALALLGVAQYLAVQEADVAAGGNGRSQVEAERGAVAGASAAVLTYLFSTSAQMFEDLVSAQSNAGSGQPHPWFTRGEEIGRDVGAAIVARGRTDGFGVAPNPALVPPTGAGYWSSTTAVASGELPGVTRWFLNSANQFRPGPPPEYLSPAFNAALAEIRNLFDTRTTEQGRIAGFWALNPGSVTAAGFWLQVGTDGINARGLSEREATHLYALVSATMYDALIGCWDAKLTYWYIRPWQADPAILNFVPVGRPNHPSYPSGHSCISASAAEVLSMFFPEDRDRLSAMVTEAGLSRMYGGIHYRFDIDAGQALGRNVAHFAIAADASGNSVLTPR